MTDQASQVAKWINETEQERRHLESEPRAVPADQAVSSDEVAELLHRPSDLARAVVHADPDDKADLYTKPGLTMTHLHRHTLACACLWVMRWRSLV
ncbi:hypothetical protein ACIBI3_00410 [Actinomadura luteofluorescens]|uniref:hypothetical protein n=1 Tax=Actinomadura luteofluorescens TaxID=46163 RepID=UPI0034957E0A